MVLKTGDVNMAEVKVNAVKVAEKAARAQFGLTGLATPATQVLGREMKFDHDGTNGFAKIDTQTVLLVNTGEGTFTSVNLYRKQGGEWTTGDRFNAAGMTYPIADVVKSTKKWAKAGYKDMTEAVKADPTLCPQVELVEGVTLESMVEKIVAETKVKTDAAAAAKAKEAPVAPVETAEAPVEELVAAE
jgi:hypothetical protein